MTWQKSKKYDGTGINKQILYYKGDTLGERKFIFIDKSGLTGRGYFSVTDQKKGTSESKQFDSYEEAYQEAHKYMKKHPNIKPVIKPSLKPISKVRPHRRTGTRGVRGHTRKTKK